MAKMEFQKGRTEIQPASGFSGEIGEVKKITIELPVAKFNPNVFVGQQVNAPLTLRQANALRMVLEGADISRENTSSGRRVSSYPDVVRFILDNVADQLGIERGLSNVPIK